MNASAFPDFWARMMFWKFSKLHEWVQFENFQNITGDHKSRNAREISYDFFIWYLPIYAFVIDQWGMRYFVKCIINGWTVSIGIRYASFFRQCCHKNEFCSCLVVVWTIFILRTDFILHRVKLKNILIFHYWWWYESASISFIFWSRLTWISPVEMSIVLTADLRNIFLPSNAKDWK